LNDLEYWLALARAPRLKPIKFFLHILNHFGSPRAVFKAAPDEWQALKLSSSLINYLQNPNWYLVEKDIQWLAQQNHHLLTLHDPNYPLLLREIYDPPPILFIQGDYSLLSSQQLAIVGTRRSSSEGEQIAWKFANALSHQGFSITSGMALGIDGASHWGALAATGKTIAVIGQGLNKIYPPQHQALAYKIIQTGAIVSEFTPDTPIKREHFLRRNRIISGLSIGTLLIETPERSGALSTARSAIEQGREVFAIPGSINNPLVKGCHQLIKDGAKLVEKLEDIIQELPSYKL
jgi:DNA processing protein